MNTTHEDVVASHAALRDIADGVTEALPHTIVVRLIAGENPVRVWREHRGPTIAALAAAAGLSQPFISQIETGKREPTVRSLVALARVPGVDLDDWWASHRNLLPSGRALLGKASP
jgi:DNA-binding XRE family transcriptional regulator